MTALSTGDVMEALGRIGADPNRCRRIVDLLRELEKDLAQEGLNVREEITGPIVDALHRNAGLIKKALSSGIEISCRYHSKIVRDFIMAEAEHPDHVWEPQTTKLLVWFAEGAGQVIIGGAYFGDHAVLMARAMQPSGGICHCFEVNPDQVEMLLLNARANKLDNVVPNEIGLWKNDHTRLILEGDDSHAAPREAAGSEGVPTFPTISIDTYGARHGLDRIDLIMLDIEGGEFEALQGAERYLRDPAGRAPAVIFEVHRSYVDWSNGLENTELVRFLTDRHYSVFAIRDYQGNVPMEGRPVEIIPVKSVYLEGPPHGFNMLAVKDTSVIDRSEIKICTNVSPKLLFHRDPRLHQPLH